MDVLAAYRRHHLPGFNRMIAYLYWIFFCIPFAAGLSKHAEQPPTVTDNLTIYPLLIMTIICGCDLCQDFSDYEIAAIIAVCFFVTLLSFNYFHRQKMNQSPL